MFVRKPMDPLLPAPLRQRALRRNSLTERGNLILSRPRHFFLTYYLSLFSLRAGWDPTRLRARAKGACRYPISLLHRGFHLLMTGETMVILLIGMFISGSVALSDSRSTVSLGCWLLFFMFSWLLIEELWFLYTQYRNNKE